MFKRLKRFWGELFHPTRKCARLGHADKIVTRRIRREATDGRGVVTDFVATFLFCLQCGRLCGPISETRVECYAECMMPSTYWDTLRRQGFVIMAEPETICCKPKGEEAKG